MRALKVAETEYVDGARIPKPGTEREIPADLVLLALGFTGTDSAGIEDQLGIPFENGVVARDDDYQTSGARRLRHRRRRPRPVADRVGDRRGAVHGRRG